MKTRIIIKTESDRRRAEAIISALPLEPVHDLVITEHKKDISSDQRRLYFLWLTVIAEETGSTKDALHEEYKSKYLVPIYERDDPEFAAMLESLRVVYREGLRDEALGLREKIVKLTSITTANVKQMTEYLHDIEMAANDLNIRLPFPDDLYH